VIPYVVTPRQLEIAEFYWCLPPGGGYRLDGPAVQEALDWWNEVASWRERDLVEALLP
jgi:hypothetical protein